ncbi:MAG: nucleotidyltransferase family protein [Candidatus Sulfotelmatobacter sp.]
MNQLRESSLPLERSAPVTTNATEWELLLTILAGQRTNDFERLRPLITQSCDWDALLRVAEDHGISSLLYQTLSRLGDSVPSPVMADLRRLYEKNIHKSLLLARELFRVLDCLDGLGVEALCYKGIVQSETYYGDMALRRSGDMDFFVRPHNLPRIKKAVRELGYTERVQIPEEAEADYIASGYECTFDSPLGKNLLELQWALQPRFYAVDFDMEGMFGRANGVSVAGRRVRTPCPEDLLLVLSIHAAKHVWGRLIWLCDIAQILRREELDWRAVQSQARALGVMRILNISFLLAQRFVGEPFPAAMNKSILADKVAQAFAEQISDSVAAGVSYSEQQISYFHLMMRLRERPMDRIRFLWRLTFTPGPGEWEAVRLPKMLSPFYRVVRMGRLAARFARG